MSGGNWDYIQYRLTDVIDDIKDEIERSGKKKTEAELLDEFYFGEEIYEQDKYHYKYPEEVIAEFKKGAELIAKAQIYMQRIDWLLSGDNGEESFLKRLKEDLDELDRDNQQASA